MLKLDLFMFFTKFSMFCHMFTLLRCTLDVLLPFIAQTQQNLNFTRTTKITFGMSAQWSKVDKWQSVNYGWQRIPSGPRLAKGTQWFKVGKGYLVVPGQLIVPGGPRVSKVTQWSKASKGYLCMYQSKIAKGKLVVQSYSERGGGHTDRYINTTTWPWPRGRAE